MTSGRSPRTRRCFTSSETDTRLLEACGRPRRTCRCSDGVSPTPIPGAQSRVRSKTRRGLPIVFVRNTTSIRRRSVTKALNDAGFALDEHEILTAPAMTAASLRRSHVRSRRVVFEVGKRHRRSRPSRRMPTSTRPRRSSAPGPNFDDGTLNQSGAPARRVGDSSGRNAPQPVVGEARQIRTRYGAFPVVIDQAAGVETATIGTPSPRCFQGDT